MLGHALPAILISSILFSFCVGPEGFSISYLFDGFRDANSFQSQILWQLRLPRTLSCAVVGGALAVAGLLLQLLLENPLAEPYTLGLSGGATLGSLLALFFGIQPLALTLPIGAIMGCLLVTFLLLSAVRMGHLSSNRNLILAGVMISLFSGSVIVLIISLFEPDRLFIAIQWMMGHFGSERDTWWPMSTLALTAVSGWILLSHRQADALLLGEDLSKSAGINPERLRVRLIVAVAALTAFSTAIAGLVGFVGLMAPHGASHLMGTRRLRSVFIPTLSLGATLVVLADTFGRCLGQGREIPAGSLVALLGAPFLVWLLTSKRDTL